MNNFEQTLIDNKSIITKYFTNEPRFLLITKKAKQFLGYPSLWW